MAAAGAVPAIRLKLHGQPDDAAKHTEAAENAGTRRVEDPASCARGSWRGRGCARSSLERLCSRGVATRTCSLPRLHLSRPLLRGHDGWAGASSLLERSRRSGRCPPRALSEGLIGPMPPAAAAPAMAAAGAALAPTPTATSCTTGGTAHASRPRIAATRRWRRRALRVRSRRALGRAELSAMRSTRTATRSLATEQLLGLDLDASLAAAHRHTSRPIRSSPPSTTPMRQGARAVCVPAAVRRGDEYDKRDAMVCVSCGARIHLMCLFPPAESPTCDSGNTTAGRRCRRRSRCRSLAMVEAEVCEPKRGTSCGSAPW